MPPFVPFALLGCAGLGLAVYALLQLLRVARTGPSGPARLVAGVLSLLGVAGIGGVGLGVAGAAGLAIVGTSLIENGPVRHLEILRSPQQSSLAGHTSGAYEHGLVDRARRSVDASDPWPIHIALEWAGAPSLKRVERWLDRHCDGDVELLSATPVERGGASHTRMEFGVRLSRGDQRDLDELDAWLDLPSGLSVEIR